MSLGPPAAGFEANFFSDHSVVVDYPIADVFSMIGTSEGHERTTRLSGLCSGFELHHRDTIFIPQHISLIDTNVRSINSPQQNHVSDLEALTRKIDRQYFTLQETVPLMFGLVHTKVNLSGTLSWDEDAKVALYESKSDSGILVWKSRVFEEIHSKRTRVTEKIRGRCPGLLRGIVQSQTLEGHVAHMDLYCTLF